MKVQLKQIIDELSEALNLPEGQKVSTVIDENENIVGWTIVNVAEDGTITPIMEKCDSLKKLFKCL